MKAKCSIVLCLLVVLGSRSAVAQEVDALSAAEVRRALVDALSAIETAAALEPKASLAISELSDETAEILFSSMPNKEQFVASARRVAERIESIRMALPPDGSVGYGGLSDPMLSSLTTAPFPPNYPDVNNVHYGVISLLGLVDSPDDRCGGADLDNYESVLAGAKSAMAIADAACSVAGCDPTGLGCLAICGAVEAVKLGVLLADVPLVACAAHGRNVDSAEIEAGYENATSTLGDLAAHDANIDGDLAAHDARILSRLDELEAMLTNVLANQAEMIRLLKTPQGRRDGWNRGG